MKRRLLYNSATGRSLASENHRDRSRGEIISAGGEGLGAGVYWEQFQFGKTKNLCRRMGGWSYNTMNVLNATELCT